MTERTWRRRSEREKTELCTFEKISENDNIATFRFFIWRDKPIIADLNIDKYAELLQAAFGLCHVDEKNALNLVTIEYPKDCGTWMEDHIKLTVEESNLLVFSNPTELLERVLKADVHDGEIWVYNISKEVAYPRGEDSWDVWFHDVDHYGRQAVLNLTLNNIMEITGDVVTICLGSPSKMMEYAVLQPDGIFQKCHQRAERLGAVIDFDVHMTSNQSELSIEYPFVPKEPKGCFSTKRGKHAKPAEFVQNIISSGSTRSVTPVSDSGLEKTQRIHHVKSLGDTIRFVSKLIPNGGEVK